MAWLGLTYSLGADSPSSRRVAVWRRLRQLGAVSPAGSLYLLPAGEPQGEIRDLVRSNAGFPRDPLSIA
jgi:hypothetical protein